AAFAAVEQDVAAAADTAGTPARDRLDRARKLRAAYAISGTVTSNADGLSMTVLVEDPATRTALWSDTVQGAAPASLANRAAGLLNDKLICVTNARASMRTDDMRIVSRLPKACERIRASEAGSVERWSELAELAPNSAWALGNEAEALFLSI